MTFPKADNAIDFRQVSLSFDEKPALIDVSFQLSRGEMIFLTGQFGSGKSVLLHLAMGTIETRLRANLRRGPRDRNT
jgi:ABC-type ATPase involved in cell division